MAKSEQKKRRWRVYYPQSDRELINAGLMTTKHLKKLIAKNPELRAHILRVAAPIAQRKGAEND